MVHLVSGKISRVFVETALAATINGCTREIQTRCEIDPNSATPVSYMVVDW
jgi:hypothetical protein